MPYPYLEKYRIPHQLHLSDKLVALLMEIAEQKPFIQESLGSPLEVQLLRKAKIRAVTYSNQIEGNALEEEQVTALAAGKRVEAEGKDVAEIENYFEAIDYATTLAQDDRRLNLRDLCDIQKLVTKGQLPPGQAGTVRTIPASIVNSFTKEVLEECPPPYDLPHLMEELLRWIEEHKERNPFAVAFAAHFITVAIHPFADGNGRTVRLLQHMLLLRRGEELARFVPSETSIMAQRERYYSTIRQTRELGRLEPFLEFMAECFATSATEVVKEAKKILKEHAGKSPGARQEKLLSYLRAKPRGVNDIVEHFKHVPKRTLERDLQALLDRKLVKASGATRSRIYSSK